MKSKFLTGWIASALLVALIADVRCSESRAEGDSDPMPSRLEGPARAWDGDTIEVAGYRVRLNGVDAPEMRDARGPVARAAMDDILMGREVICDISGKSHDRVVGRCYLNGEDIGAALIRAGWAFEHRKYTDAYAAAEAEARAAGRGFWGDRPKTADKTWFERYQVGLGPAFGLVALVLGALLNAYLNRRRDDRLREEKAVETASILAGEFLGCVVGLAHLRRRVSESMADEEIPLDRLVDEIHDGFDRMVMRITGAVGTREGVLGSELAAEVIFAASKLDGVWMTIRNTPGERIRSERLIRLIDAVGTAVLRVTKMLHARAGATYGLFDSFPPPPPN